MSTVNRQITNAVAQANALGLAPSADLSLANTYMAAANSIGLVMADAALVQQGTQQIAQAVVATTCAMIIKNGAS